MTGKPAVLVVDDDAGMRTAVATAIRLDGSFVRTAANGLEALDLLAEAAPDLVIVDVQMPALDGPGFVEAMRARGHDVPVIVMAGSSKGLERAAGIGARALLRKPFDLSVLRQAVRAALRETAD